MAAQDGIRISHMIAVVVREEYSGDSVGIDAVGCKLSLDVIVVDPGIDQKSGVARTYIRAVPAASATERQEADRRLA